MSDLSGLIDLIPIDDVAKKLGIDESAAKAAVKTALPAIVAGLAANASNEDGAASLEKALGKHKTHTTNLDDIDEEDGAKIIKHVFGSKKEAVVEAAAGKADVAKDIIAQILPIVAPIVLSWLATQFFGGNKTEEKKETKQESSGGGLGDILGGLIGSKQGQDMLGSVLGGLLGGK